MSAIGTSPSPTEARLTSAGLAVLLSGVFLAVMNTFIVNIALPSIQREFAATPADLSAIVAFYGLAYGLMLISGGRLGDLHGRRRMFVLGLAGFTTSALACGLATSAAMLIVARIGEGLAAAILFPQILAVIRVASGDGGSRRRAFAAFGVALGLSGIAGPLIGGALMAADPLGLGWRSVFLINVPIGLAACLGAVRFLPETRAEHALRLDIGGALFCALGLGLLLYPLIVGRYAGWPAWTIVSMMAGVAALVLFARDQRGKAHRRAATLIDPSLFETPAFASGAAIAFLLHSTIVAFLFALAVFLQNGLGYSPWQAALATAPIPAAFLVTSLLAGRFLAENRSFAAMRLGAILVIVGYGATAAVAMMHAAVDGWTFTPAFLIVGVGQGLFLPPLLNAVLAGVSREQAGSASGVVATCQQVGGAFGVAVVGITSFGVPSLPDPAHAFAWSLTYEIGAIMLAFCLLGTMFGRTIRVGLRRRPSREGS
ncbi:MAG: MFS transporter [Rhizobiales bacterium]|nr:MFS transporter [Hyphomicrobiales bacterium]